MTVAEGRAGGASRQSAASSAKQDQPASCLLLTSPLPDSRTCLARKSHPSRSRTGTTRPLTASLSTAEEVDSDELTSSDEEGAHASRLARSRRASLERDRQRGMRILHAAARLELSEKALSREDLVLSSASPDFTSASTSASATPTTPDELSDPSSAMSRSPSSEVDFLAVPSPDPMRRSRLHSEQGEAAFFGLADDEEDPTVAALSAQAFSAALLRRRRSRTRSGSGHFLHIDGPERKSANSLPSSRRSSIPRNVDLPIARTSTSVPTRENAILGFAPVSAGTASLGRRFGSPPRRLPWALSMSFGQAEKTAADMLSGTSVASVEDYLKVDPVDWDDNDVDNKPQARRSSVVGVRPGQSPLSAGGDATVAALEADALLAQEESSLTTAAPNHRQDTVQDHSAAEKQHQDLSDCEHEAARRSGFAMAYQHRLSNLQSQLRVLSNITSSSSSTGSTLPSSEQVSSPPSAVADESRSSLLASSWRQIARLPNLFFPGAKDQTGTASAPQEDTAPAATIDGALGRTQSEEDLLESASLSLSSLVSSPEASTITLSSEATQGRRTSTRRSSFTSRGVVSPLEGDQDPGAYVAGLGQSIDPDIELSSVVHLQSFRARGRSADTSGGRHRKRFAAVDERATASDSEHSPTLTAKQRLNALPAPLQSSDAAAVVSAAGQGEAAPGTNVKSRASFKLHDEETEEESRKDDIQDNKGDVIHRDTSPGRSASPRSNVPDQDGFITVSHHRRATRSRDTIRASRPAAEAPVPQNFSAFESASGSGSSDEERPRVSNFVLPGAAVADDDASASRARNDSDDDQTSSRGRAGRGGRGRSRQPSRETDVAPTRSRQCAVGLFTGRRASLTEDSSASMRSIRSSPNLTYARVAANGNAVAKQQTATRTSADVSTSSRPPMIRQRSEQGHSSDERSRSGRGRGDDVKVTSCSFSSDEHPRNSLPRSASSSVLLDIVKSGSLLKQKPLLSAPTGPGMSLPGSRRESSSRSSAFVREGGLPGSSPTPTEAEGLLASAVDIHQPSAPDQQSSGDVPHQPPARPTLLSNSAHLLMLSLELEMMRAQKITAPLKVRWVRQRMSVNATSSPSPSSPSTSSDTERGRDVALRCQLSASSSHRYQPRRASRLRHFTTSA